MRVEAGPTGCLVGELLDLRSAGKSASCWGAELRAAGMCADGFGERDLRADGVRGDGFGRRDVRAVGVRKFCVLLGSESELCELLG